tara:strand:- start:514 stop:1074 length:561 start_codon:yes stop_codon:yes gene_type:complete
MITSLKTKEINSLDNYRRVLENYKEKLDIFNDLEVGIKLGKTNKTTEIKEINDTEYKELIITDEYYIFENTSLQKWARWWYSENREKTFNYLDKDFTKVIKFLDKIKENTSYFNIKTQISLLKEINSFINKIIPGLYNLKKTYIENIKMKAKIDSIILVLIDFKGEIKKNKKKRKKKNILLKAYEV